MLIGHADRPGGGYQPFQPLFQREIRHSWRLPGLRALAQRPSRTIGTESTMPMVSHPPKRIANLGIRFAEEFHRDAAQPVPVTKAPATKPGCLSLRAPQTSSEQYEEENKPFKKGFVKLAWMARQWAAIGK